VQSRHSKQQPYKFSAFPCFPWTKIEIIERVQNYIEINYGRNLSIAELEKFSGYNRYYLMRLFKAQTGFTILQYINQIRKRVAEDALKRNISQKEIAYQLGFFSPAAFWLWKKRRM
jgi:two-component system response regulator YesN